MNRIGRETIERWMLGSMIRGGAREFVGGFARHARRLRAIGHTSRNAFIGGDVITDAGRARMASIVPLQDQWYRPEVKP